MEHQKHTSNILSLLDRLDREQAQLIKLGSQVIMADNGALFPLDFMLLGTMKRFASNCAAFRDLIKSWNLTAARPLLRLHIDTGLRFSAAWLVSDPHAFASAVLGGAKINKLKSPNGRVLSDRFLVDSRTEEFPWLPVVYENLSGFVHFSGAHIFASVSKIEASTQDMNFEIGKTDTNYPEFSWLEAIEYFLKANEILRKYLNGYGATKILSSKSRIGIGVDA